MTVAASVTRRMRRMVAVSKRAATRGLGIAMLIAGTIQRYRDLPSAQHVRLRHLAERRHLIALPRSVALQLAREQRGHARRALDRLLRVEEESARPAGERVLDRHRHLLAGGERDLALDVRQ